MYNPLPVNPSNFKTSLSNSAVSVPTYGLQLNLNKSPACTITCSPPMVLVVGHFTLCLKYVLTTDSCKKFHSPVHFECPHGFLRPILYLLQQRPFMVHFNPNLFSPRDRRHPTTQLVPFLSRPILSFEHTRIKFIVLTGE